MSPSEPVSGTDYPVLASLAQGKNALAIPGPSIMPDAVMAAMGRPITNIYDGEVAELSWSLVADLPKVVRTEGHAFTAIGNGHGAWEMALVNTMSRGDKVLVVGSGQFGASWAGFSAQLGLDVEVLPAPSPRHPIEPAAVADRLAADTEHQIKGLLVCHVDTGSGVRADLAAVRAAMDSANHPALLIVDGMASVGCERFEMDALGVDVTIAASQKGMMAPPGMAFVWASQKAIEAHATADLVTPYWSWTPRMSPGAHYQLFSGTPPVSHLYGTRVALDLLFEEGLEHVWWRHEMLADAVRAAVEVWSAPNGLEFQVLDPAARSNSVTGVLTNSIDSPTFQARCAAATNLTLGLGLGQPDDRFRIGHMGFLNPPMILGTLATIESVLVALDLPLGGSGVAAAAASVGQALAQGTSHA